MPRSGFLDASFPFASLAALSGLAGGDCERRRLAGGPASLPDEDERDLQYQCEIMGTEKRALSSNTFFFWGSVRRAWSSSQENNEAEIEVMSSARRHNVEGPAGERSHTFEIRQLCVYGIDRTEKSIVVPRRRRTK